MSKNCNLQGAILSVSFRALIHALRACGSSKTLRAPISKFKLCNGSFQSPPLQKIKVRKNRRGLKLNVEINGYKKNKYPGTPAAAKRRYAHQGQK
jgi:hypothetical protein